MHNYIHDAIATDIDSLASCIKTSTRTDDDWSHVTEYTFVDGSTIALTGRYSDQPVIPAGAGFDLLIAERGQDVDPDTADIGALVSVEPIIAWHLASDNGAMVVEAVTATGTCTWSYSRACVGVRFPDGRVEWRNPGGDFGIQEIRAANDLHENYIAADTTEWITLVRRVWSAQIAKEAAEAAKCKARGYGCPVCGANMDGRDADGEFPF